MCQLCSCLRTFACSVQVSALFSPPSGLYHMSSPSEAATATTAHSDTLRLPICLACFIFPCGPYQHVTRCMFYLFYWLSPLLEHKLPEGGHSCLIHSRSYPQHMVLCPAYGRHTISVEHTHVLLGLWVTVLKL